MRWHSKATPHSHIIYIYLLTGIGRPVDDGIRERTCLAVLDRSDLELVSRGGLQVVEYGVQLLDDDGQCLAVRRRLVVDVVVATVRQPLLPAERRVDPLDPDGTRRQHPGLQLDRRRMTFR